MQKTEKHRMGFSMVYQPKNNNFMKKRSERVMQNFVGLVLDYDQTTKYATIETKNVFTLRRT